MKYILALDQGTTSSRAIVFDPGGLPVAVAQQEFRQIFPRPGWVEHDAREIWATQSNVAAQALTRASLTADDIAAIGITNQRETTLVWDRRTGQPISQRHRLAGPPHRRRLRSPPRVRSRRPDSQKDRPRRRRVFFRHETRVDSRQRARCPGEGAERRTRVRHDRLVARVESHRRPPARHRSEQCLPHDALQHSQRRLGRRAC